MQAFHQAIDGFVGGSLDRDAHAETNRRVAGDRACGYTRDRAGRSPNGRAAAYENAARGNACCEHQTETGLHCSAPQRGVAGSADAHFQTWPSRQMDAT